MMERVRSDRIDAILTIWSPEGVAATHGIGDVPRIAYHGDVDFMPTLVRTRDLIEAARIDGADHPTIFWRLILPLSVPALAAFAITFLLLSTAFFAHLGGFGWTSLAAWVSAFDLTGTQLPWWYQWAQLAVAEPESSALRRYLRRRKPYVSSALARAEVGRALLPFGPVATRRGDTVRVASIRQLLRPVPRVQREDRTPSNRNRQRPLLRTRDHALSTDLL